MLNQVNTQENYYANLERELDSMAGELSECQDQLLAFFALAKSAHKILDLQRLMEILVKQAHQMLKSKAAFMLIENKDNPSLATHIPKGFFDEDEISRVMREIQIMDEAAYVKLNTEKLTEIQIEDNLYIFPLVLRDDVKGFLGLLLNQLEEHINPTLKLARAIADQSSKYVENILLHEEILVNTRLETEMDLARKAQLSLLPNRIPDLSSFGVDVSSYFRPASQVSGDFYDVIPQSKGRLMFTVGDIAGKGMPASLMMSMVLTAIRSKVNFTPDPNPERIMESIMEESYAEFSNAGSFATAFIGQYHASSHQILCANAGHSPVIYCPVGEKPRLIEADGPAIGVLPESMCKSHTLPLEPGSVLIIATDGFNEAQDNKQELFGIDNLLVLAESACKLPAKAISQKFVNAINDFSAGQRQADDQTLIVIKSTH